MRKAITVRQLRDLLNALPEDVLDFDAIAEGCDCEEKVKGIIVRPDERSVTIARTDDPHHRDGYDGTRKHEVVTP